MTNLSKLFPSTSPVLIDGGLVHHCAFMDRESSMTDTGVMSLVGIDARGCVSNRYGLIPLVLGSSNQES